ncbi:tetratricopeptide repeat protein [uncultured Microscilla sp.]|uniref:tetratricopeptide repeat protein n=1 Tax=uncultured Microscilla sp. TaxID=432653 RepID=UPI002627C34D|nr:tetratricopeptide repeat protein [uncultured Microscilla sp.]
MEKLWKCWVLLLCIQVFVPVQPFAQTNTQLKIIDSLKVRVQQPALPDTAKVDDLNELAWLYRNFDYNHSLHYAKQAKVLAQQIGDELGLATAYNRLATTYNHQGEYVQALESYRKALTIEEKIQHNYGISRAYNNMGIVFIRQRKYQEAIRYFEKSIEYLRKSKKYSKAKLAIKKRNLAVCYTSLGKLEKAIEYYLEAIDVLQKTPDVYKRGEHLASNLLGQCYLGVGTLYQKTNHFKKAREYTLKALNTFEREQNKRMLIKVYTQLGVLHYKVSDYETALKYYLQSLDLRKVLGTAQNIQGVYSNMGLTYLQLAKLDSAQHFLQKSIKLSLEKNDFQTLAQAYNTQGLLLTKQKKYVSAVEYFNKALQLSHEINDKFGRQNVLENLSNTYAKLEQYDKAFQYFDVFKNARDSLEASFRKALDYKDNYEKEKHTRALKDAELARLKEYSSRQTLANYFFGVGLLLLLVIVFGIVKNYQERRKVRRKQQKIDKLLNDQELLALSKMLEGQEKERERFAQDVHDRLGGMLSVVKMQFIALSQSIDWGQPEHEQRYDKAMNLLDETCDSVRKVSHDISAKALQKFGLVSALTDLKENIEAIQSLTVYLVTVGFGRQRLPAKYEVQVYRIVQELLGNVLKHAGATEVDIQLYWKHEEANLHISVEDNGQGFDVAEAQAKRGIGLVGLESRVKSLSGTYSIDSSLGKGTTVMVDIPVSFATNDIAEIK